MTLLNLSDYQTDMYINIDKIIGLSFNARTGILTIQLDSDNPLYQRIEIATNAKNVLDSILDMCKCVTPNTKNRQILSEQVTYNAI